MSKDDEEHPNPRIVLTVVDNGFVCEFYSPEGGKELAKTDHRVYSTKPALIGAIDEQIKQWSGHE